VITPEEVSMVYFVYVLTRVVINTISILFVWDEVILLLTIFVILFVYTYGQLYLCLNNFNEFLIKHLSVINTCSIITGRVGFLTAETYFLLAEMIILKMGAIENGVATGSAIEVLNL